MIRYNYCTNPSFESGATTNWAAANGATIVGATASVGSPPGAGALSMLVQWATAPAFVQSAYYAWSGLTIGRTYTASAYLFVPAGSISTAPSIRILSPVNLSGNSVTTPATWTRSSVTFVATATVHTVAVVTSEAAVATQGCYVDAVLLGGFSGGDYFDGSTADSDGAYRAWEGAPHLSTSVEYRYITATAEPTASPQPRISVEVEHWPDGPIEVWRGHPDGTGHRIYCPDVSGGVTQVYDYSPPLTGTVYYQARRDAVTISSNTVDLGVADAWLSVPGLPEFAVAAEITTKPGRSRDRTVGRAYPHGRSTPITRGGALRSASIPLQVRTRTEAAADALADVLEAQTRLLLRIPGVGARRSWQHVDVSGVSEDPAVHFTPETAAADDVGWWLVHDIACTVAGDPPAVPFGDPTASYDLLLSPDGSTTRTYQQQLDWKRAGGTTYLEWLKGGFV